MEPVTGSLIGNKNKQNFLNTRKQLKFIEIKRLVNAENNTTWYSEIYTCEFIIQFLFGRI